MATHRYNRLLRRLYEQYNVVSIQCDTVPIEEDCIMFTVLIDRLVLHCIQTKVPEKSYKRKTALLEIEQQRNTVDNAKKRQRCYCSTRRLWGKSHNASCELATKENICDKVVQIWPTRQYPRTITPYFCAPMR